jgi:hypothetical protein
MLPTSDPAGLADPRTEPQRMILCRKCEGTVTSQKHAVDVQGAHEHTCRNPAGYSFHLLCFREAPGCLCVGDLTTEATWFPGWAWNFALCVACHQHLGWHYAGSVPSFYGLIATRLVRPR